MQKEIERWITSPDTDTALPSPTVAAAQLHPYSCLPCRKKKRKCDRTNPCVNCRATGLECLFVPRRTPTRQPVSVGLSARIQHLELIIGQLRQHYVPLDLPQNSESGRYVTDNISELGTEFGRLALEGGRSRYVSANFWANLNEEVDDLPSLLCNKLENSDYSGTNTPLNSDSMNYAIFSGIYPSQGTSCPLHVPFEKITVLWEYYKLNCDILVKVLHIPSMDSRVADYLNTKGCKSKTFEALVMAICFTAIASLSPNQCVLLLRDNKHDLLRMFKTATEQALTRVGLLVTDEIMVLQAFTIYLSSLPTYVNNRLVWTLTALLVRLAQNAGIHRDGSHFNLSPFDTEMRRRLWWNICILDSRACEDTGYDATIPSACFDTQLPMNVDDWELTQSMTEFPTSRMGFTQMVFSVIRFECTKLFRKIQYTTSIPDSAEHPKHISQRFDEDASEVTDFQKRLYDRYLRHFDLSDPFSWYITTVCQIIFTKMRLVTYHSYLQNGNHNALSQDHRDSLFSASLVAIEYWILLNNEETTQPWRWLSETYVQWYALTYVLSELCGHAKSDQVDRAWKAVEDALRLADKIPFFANRENVCSQEIPKFGAYGPLNKLLTKAKQEREKRQRKSNC